MNEDTSLTAQGETHHSAPLSSAQERLFFLSQISATEVPYTIPWCLRLAGLLDLEALSAALTRLAQRHVALRIRLRRNGNAVEQVADVSIHFALRAEQALDVNDAFTRAQEEMGRTFDLFVGPLFRVRLIRIAKDDHLLVMPIHHIVCDGLSLRNLLVDLMACLDEVCGFEPALDAPVINPLTQAREEASPECKKQSAADLNFWTAHLDGAPRLLELPLDRPRPSAPRFKGSVVRQTITATEKDGLSALARELQVTLFTVLSAGWHALLARITGQSEIIVGFAGAGRPNANQRSAVGLFNSLLMQRSAIDPVATTMRDLAASLHREVALVTRHERLRFQDLVTALGEAGDLTRHPIFQTLIDYIGLSPDYEPARCGITATSLILDTNSARFDLELIIRHEPDGGGLSLSLKYDIDLIDKANAERILATYTYLIANLVNHVDTPIGFLPLLCADEVVKALEVGRGPERVYSSESLWILVDQGLRSRPENVAVISAEGALTCLELSERAAAVSSRLAHVGAGPGKIVAICAPRGLDLVVGLCAILRAGAAYLPLDPDYPVARLAEMISDARPLALLTVATTNEILLDSAENIHCLRIDCEEATTDLPHVTAGPDDPAYVMYTSGSSGRPKGVVVSHRAIANRLEWMQEAFSLTTADRVLQKTPISFDVSVWELFLPLMTGARLVMAPPGAHRDPDALHTVINTEGVTVLHFVPTMARAALLGDVLAGSNNLRLIFLSGEALPTKLRDEILRSTNARVFNLYGPTEAAVDVTVFDCADNVIGPIVPIGRPVANTRINVLDLALAPVPVGVVGEIYISGVQVASGYLGSPELTGKKFIPDPYGVPGERLYATGDLGRVDKDGIIHFLGRADDQIKVRGQRVEPGEIEATLNRIPGIVSSCIVLSDTEPNRDGALVAFAVADNGGAPPDVEEVLLALRSKLPAALVPTALHLTEALPILPNGKVDRKQLARLSTTRERQHILAGPPLEGEHDSSSAERRLAEAWAAVLGAPPLDRNRSFFLDGGDSIRSIELVAEARRHGLSLSVEAIFKYPSLREMAAAAELYRDTDDNLSPVYEAFALLSPEARACIPEGCVDAYPLSTLLAGLIYRSRTDATSRCYTTTVHVRAPFDIAALHDAVATVVARHPMLRSAVVEPVSSKPFQAIFADVSVPQPRVVDLGHLSQEKAAKRLASDRLAARNLRFDWGKAPLIDLLVHRMPDETLNITFIDAFLDGWSATQVMTEILSLYRERCGGAPAALAPVEKGVAAWHLAAEAAVLSSEKVLDYWRELLADAPETCLPRSAPSGAADGITYRRIDVPVSSELSERLQSQSQALGLPLKTLLFAAHVRAVSELSGQADITTAMMMNGRPSTHGGAVAVGLYLNPVPIRIVISERTRWTDLANQLYKAEATALDYRAVPFSEILRAADSTPEAIETLFNFTHFRPYGALNKGGPVTVLSLDATDQTYFPLTAQFKLDAVTNAVGLSLEVSSPALTNAQPEHFARVYKSALEAAASDAGASIVDPGRHHQDAAIARGPHYMAAKSDPKTLHEMFDVVSAERPDDVAVYTETRRWTYAELRRAADVLTERLWKAGVVRGKRVAVCVERGPLLIAAVIAIHRRGAGYVPIDPQIPAARRNALVARAGCAAILALDGPLRECTEHAPTFVCIDDIAYIEKIPPARVPEPSCYPSDPAYLMFTSGSTGEPELVVASHSAVMNRLRWAWRAFPFAKDEITCFKTSIGFVDSFSEIFSGLLAGIPTAIVSGASGTPTALVDALERFGATRVVLVPSILSEIVRSLDNLKVRLARLRICVSSGEPLATDLALAVKKKLPHVKLINLYGATEVTADALVYTVDGTETGALIPIGRPIDNCNVVVVDAVGRVAPVGVMGELLVGGLPVADGYIDDPEKTTRRFVSNPLGVHEGLVWRTRDMARIDDRGDVHFLGRMDRQIKIRGVRVDPAEVEATLRGHPEIIEAVVVKTGDTVGSQRLIAYVQQLGEFLGVADDAFERRLRTAIAKTLPFAAIPERILAVASWPRNTSGKIDVGALPPPPPRKRGVARDDPPRTMAEVELAEIWREILDTDSPSRADDFFMLGGNSLYAMRLVSRVSQMMQVDFSLSDIFNNPILADQAELLMERLTADLLAGSEQ